MLAQRWYINARSPVLDDRDVPSMKSTQHGGRARHTLSRRRKSPRAKSPATASARAAMFATSHKSPVVGRSQLNPRYCARLMALPLNPANAAAKHGEHTDSGSLGWSTSTCGCPGEGLVSV